MTYNDFMNISDYHNHCLGVAVAPLASELMERMPQLIGHDSILTTGRLHDYYRASYENRYTLQAVEYGETLPDALASLALRLIREGKMKF